MKRIFKTMKNPKIIFGLVIFVIFIFMLLLNLLTPLIADDYSYCFGYGRIHNIGDIIKYQKRHYEAWGGRCVAHGIAQFFLIYPKVVFSIFNSLIYIIFIYLIYCIAKPKEEKNEWGILIIIHLLIWFTAPVFGQTCIWLIGSCNYLWTTTIILFLILLYRNNSSKDGIIRMISVFILGIIAGWTNENTAFGLIVILLGLTCIKKILDKEKIKKWQISGILGSIAGFIILILAPGNFVRNQLLDDGRPFIEKLIKRGLDCSIGIVEYLLPLIVITVILMSIIIYYKKGKIRESIVYLIGAFLTVYAMVLSPQFPARAWFGIIIFMIIAIVNLMFEIKRLNKFFKFILIDIMIIFVFVLLSQYIVALRDINTLRKIWNERVEVIEEALESEEKSVNFKIYYSTNSKNPQYGIIDLHDNPTAWPNNIIATYYGLNKIDAFH